MLLCIFEHLSGVGLMHAACVCKRWNQLCCSVRDNRNSRMYRFIIDEVLRKFHGSHWAVAGSASLWLYLFVNKRKPFWIPNDVDVWFLHDIDQGAPACFKLDQPRFPDLTAQPADVIPFNLHHDEIDGADPYISSQVIMRNGIKIHVVFSTSVYRCARVVQDFIECQFDMSFLQIAVRIDNVLSALAFDLSPESSHLPVYNWNRVLKYRERLGQKTMRRMALSFRAKQSTHFVLFKY